MINDCPAAEQRSGGLCSLCAAAWQAHLGELLSPLGDRGVSDIGKGGHGGGVEVRIGGGIDEPDF